MEPGCPVKRSRSLSVENRDMTVGQELDVDFDGVIRPRIAASMAAIEFSGISWPRCSPRWAMGEVVIQSHDR